MPSQQRCNSVVNRDSFKLLHPTENKMSSFGQEMSRIILNPKINYRIQNTAMLACLETVYCSPYSHFVFLLRPILVLSPQVQPLPRSDLLYSNFPTSIIRMVRAFPTSLLPSSDRHNNRNMS
jgi:hypothetical protein